MAQGAPLTAPSITYIGSITPDVYASQTTHEFTDLAVGTPPLRPNKRWLVMLYSFGSNVTYNIVANGVSGSQVASGSSVGGTGLTLRHRALTVEIPEGTTVDVTVTASGNTFFQPIVFVINNVNCASAYDSDAAGGTTNTNQTIDCPAGGAIVAFGQCAGSTYTPTNCEFRNIDTIVETRGLRSGRCVSGEISATTVTGLDVDLLVTYAQAAQSSGWVVSFPPYS